MVTLEEVSKHNTEESCWLIIHGQVYDCTPILNTHPGGPEMILRFGGQDCTAIFDTIHAPGTIEARLAKQWWLGKVEGEPKPVELPVVESRVLSATKDSPVVTNGNAMVEDVLPKDIVTGTAPRVEVARPTALGQVISLDDFEADSSEHMDRKAWAYYSSGATDLVTLSLNRTAFNAVLFNPRVLVDVSKVSTSISIGQDPHSTGLRTTNLTARQPTRPHSLANSKFCQNNALATSSGISDPTSPAPASSRPDIESNPGSATLTCSHPSANANSASCFATTAPPPLPPPPPVPLLERNPTVLMRLSLPVFIAPAGLAKFSHPIGEVGFVQAAAAAGVGYMISSNASCSVEEIFAHAPDEAQLMFQLYVSRDRVVAEQLVRRVVRLGVLGIAAAERKVPGHGRGLLKAVVVTVDAASPGKREADERIVLGKVELMSSISGRGAKSSTQGSGIGRLMGTYIDAALTWNDIVWLRQTVDDAQRIALTELQQTSGGGGKAVDLRRIAIGIKGIQCVADAVRAVNLGVDIIYLSNHGGRALDGAPPALYTLLALRRSHPWMFASSSAKPPVHVFLDGGVRRGTDVVKALCLGATCVGMGRPFMYALRFGIDGVQHAIEILRDEVETTMKLLGATTVGQLGERLVNARALDALIDLDDGEAVVRARL